MYDAVNVVLSREPGVLSDSIDESCCRGGLSASNCSGVTGAVGASQCAEGVPCFSGITLALGEGVEGGQVSKNFFDRKECICCKGRC